MDYTRLKRKKAITFVLIALFFVMASVISVPLIFQYSEDKNVFADTWYDFDWAYRTSITIDNTKVDATLTDFPVLINLATSSNLSDNAQADGDDILFTDVDGTKLSHQIEIYDDSDGGLRAWVKISSLSADADTTIYMYYGHGSCSSQENINDVWTNDYHSIWLLNEGSGTDVNDYTGNSHDGVLTGMDPATDWIEYNNGYSLDFNAYTEYADAGVFADTFTDVTWGGWADMDTATGLDAFAGNGDNVDQGLAFFTLGGTEWRAQIFGTGGKKECNFDLGLTELGLHYWVVQYSDTTDTLYLYRDGVEYGPCSISAGSVTSTNNWMIGRWPLLRNDIGWNGSVENSFIATRSMTGDEISTQYNNQSSPVTFYSLGSQEEGDNTDPTNPTSYKGYDTSGKAVELVSGDWGNYTTPYFEWSEATDNSSGVNGYYLYLGTTSDADPATTSGLITANETGKYYTSGANFTVSEDLSNSTTYYFKLKTKDDAGNIADDSLSFTYKYDNVDPTNPEYVNVSPQGCSTSSSFTFTWPASTDADSDLAGYQYKKGSTGDVTATGDVLTLSTDAYQDGDNVFYLRSLDNAGNTSLWQTSVYCSTAVAHVIDGPSVVAGPSSITVNWTTDIPTKGTVAVYEGNDYLTEQAQGGYTAGHSVRVIGLEPEKAYTYKLTWADESANSGESAWYQITTDTAPSVNSLETEALSPTAANVSFNLSQNASVVLEYGIGSYDNQITFDGAGTQFSKQLTNLTAGTTYQVRVNATASLDSTKFYGGTALLTPPLPQVSNLAFESITTTAAPSLKVTWTTNTDTTSSIFYGIQGEGSYKEITSSEKTSDHKLSIPNLVDSTTYQIYASGIDEFGNIARSDTNTFQTPLDSRPPTVSDIVIETSNVGLGNQDEAQIVVSWKTDEPANSFIEYGEGISGTEYNFKTTIDPTLTTSHLVIISGLQESTPYHLRVASSDKGDNTTYSTDNTVIPGEVKKSTLTLILNALSNAFGWLGSWF